MTGPDDNRAEELLKLSTDDLYIRLGEALETDEAYAGIRDAANRAKRWLQANLATIQLAICAENMWPAFRKTADAKYAQATIIFIETALRNPFAGYPLLTISTLLFREGLDRICGCTDD